MRAHFPADFFANQGHNQSVRVHATQDLTLASVDFVDFARREPSERKLPMTVVIGGNGTFNAPYHIDYEHDAYIKSMVNINKTELKSRMPQFLENLDSLLNKVSFYKFTAVILKDLSALLDHIEFCNAHMFYKENVKMTLYLFQNSYKLNGEQVEQKRRSFPIDSQLFTLFPKTFELLIHYIKLKTLQQKAEIKFGLVVSTMPAAKKQEIDEKYQRHMSVKQEQFGINYSIQNSVQKQDDLILSNYYEGEEEQKYQDSKEEYETSINEQMAKAAEGNHHARNTAYSQMKFRDRSKRAYSISKDSTQMLEVALLKERTRCKHICYRFFGVIYSVYLMLFQQ